MGRRVRLLFCLTTAFLAGFASNLRAASDWQVVRINGWDYLTVDNVAKFYGFAGPVEPINKTVRLDNGRNQLELTLESREAIVNGVRNWLCFPVIERDGKYLVSRIDLAKSIEPQLRPHMIKNLGRIKTVVLDPGHGGVEKGAGSSYGNEKDFTLDVALKLRPLLQAKGFNVVMTRDKDELVPLQQRARIANATRDSIFVSIHFNATDYNSSATGFEIYSLTPRGAPSTQDVSMEERFSNMQAGSPVDAPSVALSTSVYHAMLGSMPEFDRGVKRARFAVLRQTSVPAILVEGGFLTERQESREIASPAWRAKLAQAIATGIDSYRGLVEKRQRPMLLADYRRQLEGVLVARNPSVPNESLATSVFQAANQLVPTAQFTTPVRHEPSPQLSLGEETPAQLEAPPPSPQPSIAPEDPTMLAALNQEEASPSPTESPEEMPGASEQPDVPPAPVESNTPTPTPTPKFEKIQFHWIPKSDPLPKF